MILIYFTFNRYSDVNHGGKTKAELLKGGFLEYPFLTGQCTVKKVMKKSDEIMQQLFSHW